MLERILLAVDMSDHARKAVPAAAELAKAGGGTVQVLHVRELYYPPVPPRVVGDSPEDAQQLVDGVVAELQQAGVIADGVVRTSTGGSPASAILEQARDVGAGIVVLGSRGLSDLGGLLLGSVAHKVIQLSACPVLVVRDEESLQQRHDDVLRAQTRFQA
jgi:nucleotide-binding universal stress UspA family protein